MTQDSNLPSVSKNQSVLSEEPASSLTNPSAALAFNRMMELASDPNFDAAKFEVMANLQVQMLDRQKEEEFRKAKNAAQRDMPIVTKGGKIEFKGAIQSHFARYEDIRRVCDPVLYAHRLTVGFHLGTNERGMTTIQPYMDHDNGYRELGGEQAYPVDSSGSKNNVQGIGSTNSYGMRYQYCAIAGVKIAGIDNDGNGPQPKTPVPLGVAEQEVVDAGRAAAMSGMASYTDWYKSQTNMTRGWLVDEGHHEKMKAAAEQAEQN